MSSAAELEDVLTLTLTEAEAKVTVQRINAAVQNLTFLVNKLYAGRGWVAAPHQVGAR